MDNPLFGKCPICQLPLAQSIKDSTQTVCDCGHRYTYQLIEGAEDFQIGTYVGKDDD